LATFYILVARFDNCILVMRYTHNAFDMSYKATIGVDFEVEKYSILDIPFTLQMWDTGNVLCTSSRI